MNKALATFALNSGPLAKIQLKYQRTNQNSIWVASSVLQSITISFEEWTCEKAGENVKLTGPAGRSLNKIKGKLSPK